MIMIFWRRVDLSVDANDSEKHAVCLLTSLHGARSRKLIVLTAVETLNITFYSSVSSNLFVKGCLF